MRQFWPVISNLSYAANRAKSISREIAFDLFTPPSARSTDTMVTNEREYMVIGLRRSANHAIINWIEQQAPGFGFHLNNLRIGENPYRYILEIVTGRGHQRDEWVAKELARYPFFSGTEGENLLRAEMRGDFCAKDFLIHSYEDRTVKQVSQNLQPRRRQRFFGKSNVRRDILILRDPFNLVASRLKSGRLSVATNRYDILSVWLEHAREFLGETNHLTNRVPINFNRWATEKSYRKEIVDNLCLPFTDRGIDDVSNFGGGSSFDHREYHGKAQSMPVLSRWMEFKDNPAFRKFFTGREIQEYSCRIFGEIPETDSLFDL